MGISLTDFVFPNQYCHNGRPIKAGFFILIIIEKSRDEPILICFFLEPRMENWMQDVEERIQHGVDLGKKSGFIKSGQPIVCITGWRQGSGSSNTVRIV